jgi:hypothetical protein
LIGAISMTETYITKRPLLTKSSKIVYSQSI